MKRFKVAAAVAAMCSMVAVGIAVAPAGLKSPNAVASAVQPGAIFSAQQSTPQGADADKAARVDPIVSPGPVGTLSAHPHVFCGAQGVSSASTANSMLSSNTTFVEQGIHSAGWAPQVKYNGTPLKMGTTATGGGKHCLFYYRDTSGSAQEIPFGLKMVLRAGTVNGTTVNLGDELIFKCGPGSTTDLAAPPAQCTSANPALSFSARFPNCWDGLNLDTVKPDGTAAVNPQTSTTYTNDHIQHMAYINGGSCPSSHPVEIIRVEQFFRFYYGTTVHDTDLLTLGGEHWSTFHTDYVFAWEPNTMDDFMDRCITPDVGCATNINLAEGGSQEPPPSPSPTPTPEPGMTTTVAGSVVASELADLTVPTSTDHEIGDTEFLLVENGDDVNVTLATAAGFSLFDTVRASGAATSATRLTVFKRVYNGQADPVVDFAGNHIIAVIVSVDEDMTGSTSATFETVEDTSGSATIPGGSGITLLLAAHAKPNSNQGMQVSGQTDEIVDQANTAGNGGLLYVVADETPASPMTYTTVAATYKAHLTVRVA